MRQLLALNGKRRKRKAVITWLSRGYRLVYARVIDGLIVSVYCALVVERSWKMIHVLRDLGSSPKQYFQEMLISYMVSRRKRTILV